MRAWILCLALVLFAVALRAERVVKVADGDTVTVLSEANEQIRVRLWGIDAPEKAQDYGEVSRKRLAERIAGKDVRLEMHGKDRYGRVLAVIWYKGENENLRQVREGLAWHYVYYAKKATDYAEAEKQAREKRIGLWKKPNPVPPWEFRRQKRKSD